MVRCVKFLAVLLILCGGSLFVAVPSAWAFGCEAHEIIAMIAEAHLTPHASAMVLQLLNDNPIDPALPRYCKQPDLDAMAYSATWADDYRSAEPKTTPWHFIDIPIGVTKEGDLAEFCAPPGGCIVQALKDQIALLRAPDTDPAKRADALRFVIHFLGDLHQPLHTADNNDLGGNCTPVAFFDETPKLTNPKLGFYAPTLHGSWDYEIFRRTIQNKTLPQVAQEIDRSFSSQEAGWMGGPTDIEAWAWESFWIAKTIAYGKLPVTIPAEIPVHNKSCVEDDNIAQRMLKLNIQLGQAYQDVATPVIRQRIAMAAARLAMVLNQTWP
jgi:hypothetical protein